MIRHTAVLPILATLALLAAAPARSGETSGGRIAGTVRVVDGDTIEVGGTRVRLTGIDAPETGQTCRDARGEDYPCGERAAQALAEKVGTATLSCEPLGADPGADTIARCWLDETDLGRWLVERGLVMAYRAYSTAYVDEEDAARRARRGLWIGTFTPPWDWRAGKRS